MRCGCVGALFLLTVACSSSQPTNGDAGGDASSTDGGALTDVVVSPGCVPTTCLAEGATCGAVSNGCGGSIDCGMCSGGAACGANGTPNLCGHEYYLSPTGDDTHTGTRASPWKTFAHALPVLKPGDELVLLDGTYNPASSGTLRATCSSNGPVVSGTADAPITIRADHARKAFLKGDGTEGALVALFQCSYWNVVGLRARSNEPCA